MKPFRRSPSAIFRALSSVSALLVAMLAAPVSADFAEFPPSEGAVEDELEYRTSEFASCGPKARCVFLRAYAGYLGERMRTLTESADPLGYLSKYPKETAARIRDYRDSIEYEFDARFAAGLEDWRRRNASGADGNPYEDYATYDALPKLIREYRSARTPDEKASLEVGIRYLLSDPTLLSQRCVK